uniref:Uncharacterized protein n=1 Tax=Helianthus annuus TaxID=4232 RepID=A0A1Y3BXT7_HELAN
MQSRRSIQQYRMVIQNFLKYFPYNRFFFPNLTLATPMFEARCFLIRSRITNAWKSSIAISRGNPHRCNEVKGPRQSLTA